MKHLRMVTIMAAAVLAGMRCAAELPVSVGETGLTCVAELADGSRIVGVPSVTEWTLDTAVGKVALPLKLVAKVSFPPDRATAEVSLNNGDKLSGSIALAVLDLQAVWGRLGIPVAQVRAITVRRIGSRWSARADFSTDVNPHGPWSYGWASPDGTNVTLYREMKHSEIGIDAWQLFEGLGVCIHRGSQVICGIRPGELSFHPGPNGEHCIVRWQAPKSCAIAVKGVFGAGDSGIVNVRVRHNATELFRATDTARDEPFSLELNVKKDDVVDFDISAGRNGCNGCSTPLDAEITVN
jgi:hypothetical protein